jgi:sialic acid synthase SpsE
MKEVQVINYTRPLHDRVAKFIVRSEIELFKLKSFELYNLDILF